MSTSFVAVDDSAKSASMRKSGMKAQALPLQGLGVLDNRCKELMFQRVKWNAPDGPVRIPGDGGPPGVG